MFPIILAHGIARFDILRQMVHERLNLPPNPLEDELQYFKNVRTHLNQNGFAAVSNSDVRFAGSVIERAAELKNHVQGILARTKAEKVHIIAHSMGGLDARLMIAEMGMAESVASLTTVGTPHLGTVLADRLLGFGGEPLIDALQRSVVKLDLAGFRNLTTSACEEFNRRARDAEAKNEVFYQVYSSYGEFDDMFLPLLGSWALIRGVDGRNDGLVSVRSQMWVGELIADDGTRKRIERREFPFRADHLNQCGWWDAEETPFRLFGESALEQILDYELKVKNIYLQIARDLENLR